MAGSGTCGALLAVLLLAAPAQAQMMSNLEAAVPPAPTSVQSPPAPPAPALPVPQSAIAETRVVMRGAPEPRTASDWSITPRGRLQLDSGVVNAPNQIPNGDVDFATEVRRAYLGIDGSIPEGFGFRLEADFSSNDVKLVDAYLSYTDGPLLFQIGQHKAFQGFEDATSDLFTSFIERASFTSAFGFERRVGLSASYNAGPWTGQFGVFTDDVDALADAGSNGRSFDGRLSFDPVFGAMRWHFAVSGHSRSFNNSATGVRYRARPFTHVTNARFVDTGNIAASGEDGLGAEVAMSRGRFHAIAEGFRVTARRSGLPDATFFGGFAEVGWFLTRDSRTVRRGLFDRVRPSQGVENGGFGAVELNVRYDYLSLNDRSAGVVGGSQSTYGVSLIWIATTHVRFSVNYAIVAVADAAIAAGADRDYSLDVFGMRAQVDF